MSNKAWRIVALLFIVVPIIICIESRKQYTIGYITHGMSETIQLEKGKWYSVEGAGELTIRPVNVRIE